MTGIMSRLDIYLGDEEISEEAEEMIMDRAMSLIMDLDPDTLSEDQAESVMSIIDLLEAGLTKKQEKNLPDPLKKAIKKKKGIKDDKEDDDESMDEIKKVRVDPSARRKRKQEYKKNKAKRKKEAKKYRKSAKGKQMAKKAKRMAKTGKTATGKKKVQYR
jgi:hypothetical protein